MREAHTDRTADHWPASHSPESRRTLVLGAGHSKVVGQLCTVLKHLFFLSFFQDLNNYRRVLANSLVKFPTT